MIYETCTLLQRVCSLAAGRVSGHVLVFGGGVGGGVCVNL